MNLVNRLKGVRTVSETDDYFICECRKCRSHLRAHKNYGKLHIPCQCGKTYVLYTGKNIQPQRQRLPDKGHQTQRSSDKDTSDELFITSIIDDLVVTLGIREEIPYWELVGLLQKGDIELCVEKIAQQLLLPIKINLQLLMKFP